MAKTQPSSTHTVDIRVLRNHTFLRRVYYKTTFSAPGAVYQYEEIHHAIDTPVSQDYECVDKSALRQADILMTGWSRPESPEDHTVDPVRMVRKKKFNIMEARSCPPQAKDQSKQTENYEFKVGKVGLGSIRYVLKGSNVTTTIESQPDFFYKVSLPLQMILS